MERRQVLYFDGLRLSAEMVDHAYHDLTEWLLGIVADFPKSVEHRAPKSLLGAYGVLDSANRFRSILQMAPGVQHSPDWHLFMRGTQDVEKLRNIVQHINQEMSKIGEMEASALGSLSWSSHCPDLEHAATGWVLAAGSLYPQQKVIGPWVDRTKVLPKGAIDDVALVTADVSVNLTVLRERVESFVRALEVGLGPQFVGEKPLGTDLVTALHVRLLRDPEPSVLGRDDRMPA